MHIVSCDVGQGDAALLVYENVQVLIDGGPPNGKVEKCLSGHMPFWDRTIELVVLSHPQLDHFGGLIGVFDSYKVKNVLISRLENSTEDYRVLKNAVRGSGAHVVDPTKSVTIRYGLLYLDILWPNQDFVAHNTTEIDDGNLTLDNYYLGSLATSRDVNDFSIVLDARFGNFDSVLTGDIGPAISDEVADILVAKGLSKSIEYIKMPHHGSKNGISEKLLDTLGVKLAVISVGAKNRFGHPNKEVLDMLNVRHIPIFRTDELGDVEVVSDGKNMVIKNK